jgi:RNA polymerase sigma factor (sigma-70 family)
VDVVRDAEHAAIERAFVETGDRLWWALLAYSGDPDVASDATAEAFARALAAADTIREPAAWVWRVAFRLATAEMRVRRRNTAEVEPAYELDDRVLAVTLALRRLSQKQRAAFVLFYLDDRATEEIGELLGMSTATVAVHLHRARRRLKAILEVDDG